MLNNSKKRLPIFCEITKEINIRQKVHIKNPKLYKTILCNKWVQIGNCPYGKNCQFAHGKFELRKRIDNSS